MARISITEANQALSTTGWAYLSLHSADPGTTGANELSGGTYARATVAWNAASNGTVTNSSSVSLNLPALGTAAYVGVWSASSAGTYYIGNTINSGTPIVAGSSAGVVTLAAGALSIVAS